MKRSRRCGWFVGLILFAAMSLSASAGSPSFGVAPDLPPGCNGTSTALSVPTSLAIPDLTTVTATINFWDLGFVIHDLNVQTFIRHSYNNDLQVSLTSPSGTKVTLTTANGSSNDDVFNGTIWDDQAGEPVTQHAFTTDGVVSTLVPEGAMGAFRYENPAGIWILAITDTASSDEGMLDGWGLSFLLRAQDSGSSSFNAIFGGTTEIIDASTTSLRVGFGDAPGYLDKVSISTNIRHTWNADLTIKLISPMGTEVLVTQGKGGNHDDVFFGTSWSDTASIPVSDASFVNGIAHPELAPEGAFAALVGENPNGLWQLSIEDVAAGDSGVLESWGLFLTFATCERDFGDAPESYSTLEQDDGARHYRMGDVYLGASIDFEGDGRPTSDATGDDSDGGDDEDGVFFPTPFIAGEVATISATSSSFGVLNAWMDFGVDGTWTQPGDWTIQNGLIAATTTSFNFVVPATATTGATFARFRPAAAFSKNNAAGFKGTQDDGEVEDYQVTIYRRGSVHGFSFRDQNADGVYDDQMDTPIESDQVILEGNDIAGQALFMQFYTDSDGRFTFENLPPSDPNGYQVSVFRAFGNESSPPAFVAHIADGEEYVAFPGQANLPPGDPRTEIVVGQDLMFGAYTRGSIHAFSFVDGDLDGEYDSQVDAPLVGGLVYLTGQDGAGNSVDRSIGVNPQGSADFENLIPGEYSVYHPEALGYSAPMPATRDFTVKSGNEIVGVSGQARLTGRLLAGELDGSQVFPASVTTSASGVISLSMNQAGEELHYSAILFGFDFGPGPGSPARTPDNLLDDIQGVRLYGGNAGQVGSPALELYPTTQDPDDSTWLMNPDGSIVFQGVWDSSDPSTTPLSAFAPNILAGMPSGSAGLYLEVQTAGFPEGEVRGQIYKIFPDRKSEIVSEQMRFANAVPTRTPTQTSTTTETPTPSATPSRTATPTQTHTGTSTPTITPTATNTTPGDPSPTPTQTSTLTGTATPTHTGDPTATETATPTITNTGDPTATNTATPTQTETLSITPTETTPGDPSPTPTGSLESTATPTSTGGLIVSDCDLNGDGIVNAKDITVLVRTRPKDRPNLLFFMRCWSEVVEQRP